MNNSILTLKKDKKLQFHSNYMYLGFVELVFYGPSTLLWSFRAWSVTYPHCFWASLLGGLPVLSALSFASNCPSWISRRERMVVELFHECLSDVRIEPATLCIPGRRASDRATVLVRATEILKSKSVCSTDDIINVIGTCVWQSQIVTKTNDLSFSSKSVSEIDYFSNTL